MHGLLPCLKRLPWVQPVMLIGHDSLIGIPCPGDCLHQFPEQEEKMIAASIRRSGLREINVQRAADQARI